MARAGSASTMGAAPGGLGVRPPPGSPSRASPARSAAAAAHGDTSRTIFPNPSFDAMRACARPASAKPYTRSTTGSSTFDASSGTRLSLERAHHLDPLLDRPRAQERPPHGRASSHEGPEVELHRRASERADDDDAPAHREAAEVLGHVAAADELEHHVRPAARGRCHDLLREDAILHDDPVAEPKLRGRPELPLRARGPERRRADRPRNLHSRGPTPLPAAWTRTVSPAPRPPCDTMAS